MSAEISLSRKIVSDLKDRIRRGSLRCGDRIPASRRLATELGVARGTVVTALEILTAEGLLEARVGSGTYVSADASFFAEPVGYNNSRFIVPAKTISPPNTDQPVSGAIDFRPCGPSLEAFPTNAWQKCVASSALATPSSHYGDPRGLAALRTEISNYLRRARGLVTSPDNILVTNGAVHAMHLVASLYLQPGRKAIVEDPGYPLARQVFEFSGAEILAIDVDDCGLVTDRLPKHAKSVGLIYVTPSHQFPIGTRLSLGRRHALLAWASHNDVLILEDDYDGEFRYDVPPLPPLASMSSECVIYCGTFSKTMFPDLRLGFAVAPTYIVDTLSHLRTITQYSASRIPQHALAQFISQGHYERHIQRMRKIYSAKRAVVSESLESFDIHCRIVGLESGLNCTVDFPDSVDVSELVAKAATKGVLVHHLARFAQSEHSSRNAMVLGYAAASIDEIRLGIGKILG